MTLTIDGRDVRGNVPEEALPDCQSCPKPELVGVNYETAIVYRYCGGQQQYNDMSGHWRGMRLEAVVAAIQFYASMGRLTDPEGVMERIWILDEIQCRIHNAAVEAEANRPKS